MLCRERPYQLGATVKARDVVSYPLPDGLPEGAEVKVVEMESGSRVVEYQGKRFRVSMTNVTAGMLYQVGGNWLGERDSRVLKVPR